jgi:hypothetical protein
LRKAQVVSRRWYLIIGLVFVLVGVNFLLTRSWVEAAWCFTIAGGNLFIVYAQKRPELLPSPMGSIFVLIWVVTVGVLTLLWLSGT